MSLQYNKYQNPPQQTIYIPDEEYVGIYSKVNQVDEGCFCFYQFLIVVLIFVYGYFSYDCMQDLLQNDKPNSLADIAHEIGLIWNTIALIFEMYAIRVKNLKLAKIGYFGLIVGIFFEIIVATYGMSQLNEYNLLILSVLAIFGLIIDFFIKAYGAMKVVKVIEECVDKPGEVFL